METFTPADIRELMLYARPGEGPVSGAELERRRNGMRSANPGRFEEYRSASLSVGRWQREFRSASRTSMTIAELRGRLSDLEDLLRLESGELTR